MKKVSLRKTILVVAIMVGICLMSSMIYATGDIDDLLGNIENIQRIDSNTNTNTNVDGGTNTNISNVTELPTTKSNTANSTNTNIANNTGTTKLPQTGVDDTVMWVLIGASAVLAIYTYKKVRDYNDK